MAEAKQSQFVQVITEMENIMEPSIKSHYIAGAARNTTEALMMAMQLWTLPHVKRGDLDGVQEFVEIINASAIKLRNICERHEYNMNERNGK